MSGPEFLLRLALGIALGVVVARRLVPLVESEVEFEAIELEDGSVVPAIRDPNGNLVPL